MVKVVYLFLLQSLVVFRVTVGTGTCSINKSFNLPSLAAISIFKNPSILTEFVVIGSAIERGTEPNAA